MFYDELNKVLEEFIGGYYREKDYTLVRNFTDIILSSKSPWCNAIYHSKMGLDKCQEYSIDFLGSISPKYGEHLSKLIDHGKIEFKPGNGISSVDVREGVKFLKVYHRGTIEDSYTLTHETMHEINLDVDNATNNWDLMTEAFSILAEKLQKDYFAKLSEVPRNYRHNEHDTLYALYCRAVVMDFELRLIRAYHKFGGVNQSVVRNLLTPRGQGRFYASLNSEDLQDIVDKQELSFHLLQRDIIGGVLSTHMYERISNKPKLIKEFVELNDSCNEMDFVDTLKYLDLDVVDEDAVVLSKRSIRKLRSEYIKRCKDLTR